MSSAVLIEKALLKAREAFHRNVTKDFKFRQTQLKQLRKCLTDNCDEFMGALKADLHKPKYEAMMAEYLFCLKDIDYQLAHLKKYSKPQYVTKKGLAFMLDTCYVKYEPLGVALIISPWNYPVQLAFAPLAAAIAAGCCAILKPSEVSANCEQMIAKLLPKYLDQDCYHVITGGPEDSQRILQERFDVVFFTGSPQIGKIIYTAASKHLTPCVLELGGKSPCYIDDSVGNFEIAVKRILWGKTVNSGQTCIAPDYIMCTQAVQEKFVATAKKVLKDFFSDDAKKSDSYGRMINERNFDRVVKTLESTSGKVVIGGDHDREQLYIAPTIVTNVISTDSLMKEELFGPIIPIMVVDSPDEAIEFIKRGEKPLTMYLYTNKKQVYEKFSNETSSGSVAVNECLFQMCVDDLPFGGVGQSGLGRYHGEYSFEAFSHKKAVYIKDYNPLVEFIGKARYPPITEAAFNRLKPMLYRSFLDDIDPWSIMNTGFIFLLGVVSGLLGILAMQKL